MTMRHLLTLLCLLALTTALAAWAEAQDTAPAPLPVKYAVTFTPGGWNPAEWIVAKSTQVNRLGHWLQQPDCIVNETPADATVAELEGARWPETYSSMVYHRPVPVGTTITATMAFTSKQAPLIVLSPEIGVDAAGRPEYRNHFEIVLWNEGVNVWRHSYNEGKPSYVLAAFAKFPLVKDTKYTLVVQTQPGEMTISVDGHVFGYHEEHLPATFYAGITGDEGLNRFYDFALSNEK
ncbi:MAG TPA: hypothetical protein VGM19_04855 [Armatimonadota bacterium]|jgi:hypothetical protein